MTAEAEPWFDEELWFDEDEAVVALELDESSSPELTLAVVAVSDWPDVVDVEPVVAVPPSEPFAAIAPKEIAKVASAAATTRRRMSEIRRARSRSRSRTRSAFEVGGGVEGMRSS